MENCMEIPSVFFFFFNLLSGVCEASDNSLAEEKGIFFII